MELSISSYTPVNTVLDYCFTLFFVCFLITSANDDESLPFCPCCCYLWLPLTISMQRQSFCVLWHRLISRLMRKFQDVKQVLLHSETYLSIHSLWFLQNLLYFQFFYFTKWLAVTMDLTAATATWLIGLMLTNVTLVSRDDEKVSKEEMHTAELWETTSVTENDQTGCINGTKICKLHMSQCVHPGKIRPRLQLSFLPSLFMCFWNDKRRFADTIYVQKKQ